MRRRQFQFADDTRGGELALGQAAGRHCGQRRDGGLEATSRHPGEGARRVPVDHLEARPPTGKHRQVPFDLLRDLAACAVGFSQNTPTPGLDELHVLFPVRRLARPTAVTGQQKTQLLRHDKLARTQHAGQPLSTWGGAAKKRGLPE